MAVIPARGGSKGIPDKNIRPFAGKPLLAHTIEQAKAAAQVGRVVVSTDDNKIGAVAKLYGAEVFERPLELSGDTAPSESALGHVLDCLAETENYQPELVVFLQCTSPIRRPNDIDQAIKTFYQQNADSLLSVVHSHRFLWRLNDENRPLSYNYDYKHRPRRQDRPPEYVENGSIYLFKPSVLQEFNNRLGGIIALYQMDSWSHFDIDTPEDWAQCEWAFQQFILE